VCVATCRRPEGLARLLASLGRQTLPPALRVEIVVVDDHGDPEVERIARKFDGAPHPVRVAVEGAHNVARARNRALREACGRLVAFVDDDEEAEPGWLGALWRTLEAGGADVVFGPVLPVPVGSDPSGGLPASFFARRRHPTGTRVGLADARTGNCLAARSLLLRHGFDAEYGRSGGEDADLFGRLLRDGARFVWCDEALVSERMPPERRRPGWILRRAFRGGCVHTRIELHRRGRAAWRGLPRALAAWLVLAAALPFARLAGPGPALRVARRAAVQAGHLWAFAGLPAPELS